MILELSQPTAFQDNSQLEELFQASLLMSKTVAVPDISKKFVELKVEVRTTQHVTVSSLSSTLGLSMSWRNEVNCDWGIKAAERRGVLARQ